MRQHRELYLRLDDAEQLPCYAQSAVSKHNALGEALRKARAKSRYWERKAKEGIEKAAATKKGRDEAKEEAHLARLTAVVAGDTKARAEDGLARVQDTLVVTEEAKHKAEAKAETTHLEVERMSLLLEIKAAKDEVSSSSPKQAKTKKPWRKTTKRPWR